MITLGFILGAAAARRFSRESVHWFTVGAVLAEITTSPIAAAFWRGLTGGAQ